MNSFILKSLGWDNINVNDILDTSIGKIRVTHKNNKTLYIKCFDVCNKLSRGDSLNINNIKFFIDHIKKQKIKLKVSRYG